MSHRRVRVRPIREVELRITVEADKGTLDAISRSQKRRVLPGPLSFKIREKNPIVVARKARRLAEKIREASQQSERV